MVGMCDIKITIWNLANDRFTSVLSKGEKKMQCFGGRDSMLSNQVQVLLEASSLLE